MALAVKRLISCDSSLIYVKIGSQVFSFFFLFVFFLARQLFASAAHKRIVPCCAPTPRSVPHWFRLARPQLLRVLG